MLTRLIKNLTVLDHSIINWVILHQDRRVRNTFYIITYLGSGYIWFLAYFMLFIMGTDNVRDILFSVILAEVSGLLIIIVLRNLVKRERPKAVTTSILPWQNYSFPSHHALRVTMLATVIGKSYHSLLLFLILGAIIVSISRIYLERHYPFDVLVGSLLGFLCAIFVIFVF